MTLYEFNLLPYDRQLVDVFDHGNHLAWRWEEETALGLYELPGRFFVELAYDTATNNIVGLRSFTSTGPLEDYAATIGLRELGI